MADDEQLLEQYRRDHSEPAFGELVRRHIDLVYAAALRMTGGERPLAEDVTQLAFIALARQAWRLPQGILLAGWLYRHTCFTAAKAVRTERRRKAREQIAMEIRALEDSTEPQWELIAPLLDEGLNRLSARDRDAIILRFLKQQDLRAVGLALGISEDAAQKRVGRALEKLRIILSRRGISVPATALSAVLAADAATATPAGLAASVTAASLTAAQGTGTALALLRFMATTKLKAGLAGAILVIASVVTPLLIQHQAQAKASEQQAALRQQAAQLARLQEENAALSNRVETAESLRALPSEQLREVLRLRGEVSRLRAEAQQLQSGKTTPPLSRQDLLAAKAEVWAQRLSRFKQWLEANPSERIPELRLLNESDWLNVISANDGDYYYRRAVSLLRDNAGLRMEDLLYGALKQYKKMNDGQFPTDLSQLNPYFKSPVDDAMLQRWEIVPANSLVSELQPGGDWVITQKAPVNADLDGRNSVGLTDFGFAGSNVTNRWTLLH